MPYLENEYDVISACYRLICTNIDHVQSYQHLLIFYKFPCDFVSFQAPVADPQTHPLTMHEVAIATKHKPKLKLKNTGNWRKEILGDITVMNPEEVIKLQESSPYYVIGHYTL